MPTAAGLIQVFTFKEGALARVAHDLRLSLTRFRVSLEREVLDATFETASLRVDGAMRGGELDEHALDAANREDIERTIGTRILDSSNHPLARLEGRAKLTVSGYDVAGVLELAGKRRDIDFHVLATGDELAADVELVPSRWGIRPYTALLGAIRLADRVRVVARLRRIGV